MTGHERITVAAVTALVLMTAVSVAGRAMHGSSLAAASINPGKSGGALVDRNGRLAGSPTLAGVSLRGVACPTTQTCYATGEDGTIVATTDGGSIWHSQRSGTTTLLNGVACPSPSTCLAVGGSGTIVRSTDGGRTWRS